MTVANDCRQVMARYGKSFALASKFLPAGCRDDAAIIYAYCRHVDDAIDLSSDDSFATLEQLERELQRIYDRSTLDKPLLRAFRDVKERRAIPLEYPLALLRGMRMDVERVRYQSLAELEVYCFRVAGTVGLMMCHVMGVASADALRYAAALGIAMQLTNISRDVAEDWQRGRLYLPRELLGGMVVAELQRSRDIACPLDAPLAMALRPAVRSLLNTADTYYALSDEGLAYLSPRCAVAVRAARLVYAAIGDRIRDNDYDVLRPRAYVGTTSKCVLVARACFETLFRYTLSGGRFEPAPLEGTVNHVASDFPL